MCIFTVHIIYIYIYKIYIPHLHFIIEYFGYKSTT